VKEAAIQQVNINDPDGIMTQDGIPANQYLIEMLEGRTIVNDILEEYVPPNIVEEKRNKSRNATQITNHTVNRIPNHRAAGTNMHRRINMGKH
jgi:hypothetical protein